MREYNRGGIVGGGSSALEHFARGGLVEQYSDGGMVHGGARLITVAEEGNPEMIIPLSSQRRERALKLWAKAGEMMDVPGFARGGVPLWGSPENALLASERASSHSSNHTSSSREEGLRLHDQNPSHTLGTGDTHVNLGGLGGVQITVQVNGDDNQNIANRIRGQAGEIADAVAGILADAFAAQFENTPRRGRR